MLCQRAFATVCVRQQWPRQPRIQRGGGFCIPAVPRTGPEPAPTSDEFGRILKKLEPLDALGQKLEALDGLGQKLDALGAQVKNQGEKLEALGEKLEALEKNQGEKLKALEKKVDQVRTLLGTVGEFVVGPWLAEKFGPDFIPDITLADVKAVAHAARVGADKLVATLLYEHQGLKAALHACVDKDKAGHLINCVNSGDWKQVLSTLQHLEKQEQKRQNDPRRGDTRLSDMTLYAAAASRVKPLDQYLIQNGTAFMTLATALATKEAQNQLQVDCGRLQVLPVPGGDGYALDVGEIKSNSADLGDARKQLMRLAKFLGWAICVGQETTIARLTLHGNVIVTLQDGGPANAEQLKPQVGTKPTHYITGSGKKHTAIITNKFEYFKAGPMGIRDWLPNK